MNTIPGRICNYIDHSGERNYQVVVAKAIEVIPSYEIETSTKVEKSLNRKFCQVNDASTTIKVKIIHDSN